MKKSIFIDFETTGLIPKNPILKKFSKFWPHIVQMAWLIYEDGVLIEEKELIIKPTNFTIPKKSTKIHGISQNKALKEGVEANYALAFLLKKIDQTDVIIGHNIRFDLDVLKLECIRNKFSSKLQNKKIICTMLDNKIFRQPSNGFLYEHLFQTKIENAHNAIFDIKATAKIFFELKRIYKI